MFRTLLMTVYVAGYLSTNVCGQELVSSLSLTNDRLNFFASISATQNATALIWNGGRNGVFGGQSVFVEARTTGLESLNLNTSLTDDDLGITWSFTSSGKTKPGFPLTIQSGSVSVGDFDWRDSSGQIVEQGLAGVQILSGNWQITSPGGFAYVGPANINSLDDLAFSARLFNSFTVPEPSCSVLVGAGILAFARWRPSGTRYGEPGRAPL